MAQPQPTEQELLFDKLHVLIGQGSHAKVIRAADQSRCCASRTVSRVAVPGLLLLSAAHATAAADD